MSELFSHLITKVRHSLVDRPITAAERQRARALLPEPMIPGNYEAASTPLLHRTRLHQECGRKRGLRVGQ